MTPKALVVLSAASSAVLAMSFVPAAFGQSSKPGAVSCSIRKTPATPAENTFASGQFKEAIDLFAAETGDPDRAHNAVIRATLWSGQPDAAHKDAGAWLAQKPGNAWALDADADVKLYFGDVDKAGDELRSAAAANFCIAQVHADYATYLAYTGYHASAASQLGIAQKLEPTNRSLAIGSSWISPHGLYQGSGSSCHLTSTVPSASIPYRAIHNGSATNGQRSNTSWGLDVILNDKPLRLHLNSGVSGILLKPEVAEATHLSAAGSYTSHSIGNNDTAQIDVAHVETIKAGPVTFADCDVRIMHQTVMMDQWNADRAYMEGFDGEIGTDVFQSFLVTLDNPSHTLKLDPLPPAPTADRIIAPAMATWTKAFREGDDLIVPVRLNKKGPFLFGLASGSIEIVDLNVARQAGHVTQGMAGTFYSATGQAKDVYTTQPTDVDFGGIRQQGRYLVSRALPPDPGPVGTAGYLGYSNLHLLTIQMDYRDQLVKFTYDESRLPHCVQGVTLDDCVNFN